MQEHNSGFAAIDLDALKAVVDSLRHAAAILGADGGVLHENSGFRILRNRAEPAIPVDGFLATLGPQERARIEGVARGTSKQHQNTHRLEWCLPGALDARHVAEFTRMTHRSDFVGLLCQVTENGSTQNPTLRYLMEHLDQGVWEYNLRTGAFIASRTWRAIRGWSEERPIDMSNDDWLEDIHPEDRDRLKSELYGHKTGDSKAMVVQYRHRHSDGHWVWILCRASVVEHDASGAPAQIVGTDTDITEAMDSQDAINRLAGKLKLAVEASGMGIWEFNPDTRMVHWDDRMLEIYGITDGQNARRDVNWQDHLHPDDYEETVAYAQECERQNADFKRDYRILRPDGSVRHIRSLARTVAVPNAASKLIGVNIDVTQDYLRAEELELARLKLEHDALHDTLTDLGNRRALYQASTALFNRVSDTSRYAAMHIDLDHFKAVNDTLGHSAGDFVLSTVGRVLTDVIGDLGRPFRVGGDEFAVLFEEAPEHRVLNTLCEDLIEAISAPLTFEGQPCSVGASIGYATGTGPPKSQTSIFAEADTALYAAKRAGRLCYRVYTDAIGAEFHKSTNPGQALRRTLQEDQIVCFFQPQYDAQTLEVVGAEALVRWHCPERGLLAPAQFLQNAVDAGMLDAIDHCVFRRVTALQTERMRQGLRFPRISVNVSRARLGHEDLLDQIREELESHHSLTFELLETTFFDTPSTELQFTLDSLRDMDIRIEMDDFGTGYASVKALQAIQPDAVKIDRSLVAPLGADARQLEILQNLTKIARLESADVVVEGLETGAHMAAIRMLDCDVLQGYVLQRPMAEVEFAALLKGFGKNATSKSA